MAAEGVADKAVGLGLPAEQDIASIRFADGRHVRLIKVALCRTPKLSLHGFHLSAARENIETGPGKKK